MGALAAVRAREEGLRTMAHDALDTWLDQIEAETADTPTLLDLSERFLQTRLELLGRCLEAVIRQRYAADLQQTEARCPCGRRLHRRRFDAKEISTLHGRFTLHRPYFYCDVCEKGFHPLDAKLGLSDQHHQFDIQQRSTRLGAELPFGLSAEQFVELTGVAASPHFIHATVNAWTRAGVETPRRGAGRAGWAQDETRARELARSQGRAPLSAGQRPSRDPCRQLAPDRREGGLVAGDWCARRAGAAGPGADRVGRRWVGLDLGPVV